MRRPNLALIPARARWLAEVDYSHGPQARAWAEALLDGRAQCGETQDEYLWRTMARSAVRGAIGVVVHGQWACRALTDSIAAPVVPIDFPAFLGPEGPPTPPPPDGPDSLPDHRHDQRQQGRRSRPRARWS